MSHRIHRAAMSGFVRMLTLVTICLPFVFSCSKQSQTDAWDEILWFYDHVEKKYYVGDGQPPYLSPWNHEAVFALVYTCGDCTSSQRFVAYYMKYSDDYVKGLIARKEMTASEKWQTRHANESEVYVYYSTDCRKWFANTSTEARGILEGVHLHKCPKKLKRCHPVDHGDVVGLLPPLISNP